MVVVGTGDSRMKTGHRASSTAQVPACEIEEYFLEVPVVGFQASQKHALPGEIGGEGGNQFRRTGLAHPVVQRPRGGRGDPNSLQGVQVNCGVGAKTKTGALALGGKFCRGSLRHERAVIHDGDMICQRFSLIHQVGG